MCIDGHWGELSSKYRLYLAYFYMNLLLIILLFVVQSILSKIVN